MSTLTLLKNFAWKTLAEGLSRVLGLLLLVLLARRLGDQGFGLYSLPLASAGLLAVVLDPGTHSLLIRELAHEPKREAQILGQIIWLRIICSLLFFVLLLISWPAFATQLSLSRLMAAGCILLGQSWIDTQIAWLNARQAFRDEARLRFWLKLGLLVPPLLVLWLYPNIDTLLWASAAAHLAWLPIFGRQLQKIPNPQQFNLLASLRLLRQGLGFWLANLSWLIYAKLDLVMLPLLGRSAAELGWYQAAVRFYELLSLPGYLLTMAAFPQLSALQNQPEQFHQGIIRLLKLEFLLGICMAGLGLGLALFLPHLLGPAFAPSVQALQWMSLSLPAVCLNLGLFTVLGASGHQDRTAWSTGISLGLNAGLNLYLIPCYGYFGAAISTLCADLLLCGLLGWQLHMVQSLSQRAVSR